MRKLLAGLLLAVAAVIALFTLLSLWPAARLTALYAVGRSSICTFEQTLAAEEALESKAAINEQVVSNSRLLETDGELELWSTPMGDIWAPKRTNPRFLVLEQIWDVYGREGVGVRPGDVVLDCGANVGVFTRKALDQGATTVVAVEPSPENIECLRRNFGDEIASGRVILKPIGVWDSTTTLQFFEGPNSAVDSFVWHWDQPPQANALEVPVTTIDALVDELGLDRVDFLKLDVEGAEARTILGARQTVERFKPRIAFDAEGEDIPQVREAALAVDPSYELVCGPCEDARTKVRPTTAYFR